MRIPDRPAHRQVAILTTLTRILVLASLQTNSDAGRRAVEVSKWYTTRHTDRQTDKTDSTPNEWSALRRETHSKQKRRKFMPSAGFEPVTPNNEAAADARLRPHGHRDRLPGSSFTPSQNIEIVTEKRLPSVLRYAAMTWNSDYKESDSFLPNFDVLLTVHISTISATDQLNAQNSCVLEPVHRTATYRVWRYQILYNTIWPPDDEHNSARNM